MLTFFCFLQLSPHTHLFLDETALESGQLDAEGVRNLTALGNVISWQKLGYNFSYHSIDFLTDVPCLVLSEGRSILPSDIQLLMKPQQELNIDEVYPHSSKFLLKSTGTCTAHI